MARIDEGDKVRVSGQLDPLLFTRHDLIADTVVSLYEGHGGR